MSRLGRESLYVKIESATVNSDRRALELVLQDYGDALNAVLCYAKWLLGSCCGGLPQLNSMTNMLLGPITSQIVLHALFVHHGLSGSVKVAESQALINPSQAANLTHAHKLAI